eukprot:SAG31_NODE_51047_length_104_cov_11.000000_1_plen_34_part_11
MEIEALAGALHQKSLDLEEQNAAASELRQRRIAK